MSEWIAKTLEHLLDFSNILNASIAASWMVLAVIVLRFLLKKAPRWIHVSLWGLVAVRLLLPFSIESPLSLIPSAETIPQELLRVEGVQLHEPAYLDVVSNPIFTSGTSVEIGQTIDRVQEHMIEMTPIWLIGIAVLLIYTFTSYWYLRRKVNEAVILRDNIFQSENAGSPFVLGIIKPRIYLPYKIEEQTLVHVIAHEQAHIQRKDHWWKPLGFLLLTIHWFNPLMWLGYVLLCRDIELACDEKVIKDIDNEQRANYSQALVACSVKRPIIAACPLAFGEVGVKERVKSVLNYKKPAFWIITVAVVACIVVAVCFGTNPSGQFLTKWDIVEVDMSRVLEDVQSLSVQYWNTSIDCNDSEINRFLATMSKIKVGRKPISISRDEGRSAVFTLTFDEHLKLHFNEDFTELWVDNGVKSSYTYKITNPSSAEELLLDFSFTAYGDSTKWDCSVICVEASAPDHYVINYSDVKVSSQTGTLTFQNRNDFDIVVHILREGETEVVSDRIPAGGCYSLLKVNDKPCTIGVHADVDVNTEIKLFVYDGNWSETYSMIEHHATKWFDCLHGDEMVWDGMREINLDEYPGVTFRAYSERMEAVTDKETVTLYTGMPIWSVFFCDMNGDGKPELCSSTSLGSGLVDNRFIIYDYANGASYERSDRGQYDYTLNLQNGKLIVEKRGCMQDELLASGELACRDNTYQIIWNFENETGADTPNSAGRSYTYNVAFANWTDNTKIYTGALNWKTIAISSVQHLPIYKFDTAAELDAFKASYSDILTMDQGLDETPSFDYITAAYSDSFFSKHSLMLAYVPTSSGSYRFGVSDVYCDTKSFCMYIEQLNAPEVYNDMMSGWFAVVEVDKEDIANCTDFDAQLGPASADGSIVDTENNDIRIDVCELYLEVLEDLWNVDPGLNGGISQIGIDLSELSHLTEVEKETVMHEFASKHNLPYIAGTWEELCEQGYIDKDNLYWEDGLFFSIKTNEDAVWNLPALKEGDPIPELTAFDAQKWRSGLGAYYFGQCSAQKNADRKWSYTVGQEAIS